MNIAISTVLILILILPGLTLRKFYFSEEFSSQFTTKNFFELIISTFLPSILLHSISIWIIGFFDYQVDFEILGKLLTSKDYSSDAFKNINQNKFNIFEYQVLVLSLSAIAGYTSRKIIRHFLWDSKFKIFRFQNSWHYIVTGEFFNFKRAAYDLDKEKIKAIDFTYVDVLIDTDEGTMIYDGYLVDYELSNRDDLKYITLKNVQRRYLKDDSKAASDENKYYKIPGHIVVIPSENIINLNFSYYKFVKIEDGVGIELVK